MNINLDTNQKKAVITKERNVLVVAAPGAGKTTVIVNRVNHLIEERRVYNNNIYVITFTKAAADNMRERYKNTFRRQSSPFFGTFHGLFYKMLIRENYKLDIISTIVVQNLIKAILSKYFDDISEDKVREIIGYISKYKTSKNKDIDMNISQDIFNDCYSQYEEYKSKNNLYDFDDLALIIIKKLNSNKIMRNYYKNLFKFMMVDEFQDCDELQIEFLNIINEENELFAVGDEDQCIYSFRGSKPEYMVKFDKVFKGGVKVYLNTNYRSCRNIVELSKNLITNNINRNKKEILWNKDQLGKIVQITSMNESEQGNEIVKIIEFNEENYNDVAILYRTNIESRSIVDSFIRNKIPFNLLDKNYNFFNHFICKDILAYMNLAINEYDKESFVRIINKPFRYISKGNIDYIQKHREVKSPFDILIEKKDFHPYQSKNIDDLRKSINSLNKYSLGTALQMILTDLKYYDYLNEFVNKQGLKMEELEEIIEEFKNIISEHKSISSFLLHVENVGETLKNKSKDKEGVLLSTIHGVKGMEFKTVFLINVVEEVIPYKLSVEEGNIEEERRLFYVGITRAIQNLYISSPKFVKGKINEESRFVKESKVKELIYESIGFYVGERVVHKEFGDGEILEIKDGNIKIIFDNRILRAFSLEILIKNRLLISKDEIN